MTRAYLAFTDTGLALAKRLAAALPGSVARCGQNGVSLAEWTSARFVHSDALIFVGAAGIAVRAIAPHCKSKTTDPAVVVVDECGRFAVPILSGHLGGANDLARAIAAVCGAVPVITTATDAHGIFAVDEWAKHQNCTVLEPERIKLVSGKLLAGQPVYYRADFPVTGTVPAGLFPADTPEKADFALTLCPTGQALHLVPRIGVLGIGCKRGTSADTLEAALPLLHPTQPCCAGSHRRRKHRPEAKRAGLAGLLSGARLAGAVLLCRTAAQRARTVHPLPFCTERDRGRQCLRASGCAGRRRQPVLPEICLQRRDPCAGVQALCPGLEVAECLT